MDLLDLYNDLHVALRIVVVIVVAVLASLLVQAVNRLGRRLAPPATRAGTDVAGFAQQYPKIATVTSLVTSALTFIIYFVALGLVLNELEISLTAYLATASVVGLAIGFGSQGLVQDIVIGLTLVFSDAIDIGDMVEISGQVGVVEQIGLRFTVLSNFNQQRVYIPNRNITVVSRFRNGCVRAYMDIQIPDAVDQEQVVERVSQMARATYAQHGSILLTEPELFKIRTPPPGSWPHLRVKFRIWPGQQAIIESTVRQRIIAAMRELYPAFADWMVAVTYRVN